MRSPREASETPARILAAAVDRFGRDGFGTGLRAIGADADVSAAAVMKWFGSKEGLRLACDEHVLSEISAVKSEAMRSSDLRGPLIREMAVIDEYQPLIRYFLRSMMDGSDLGRRLLLTVREQAITWMNEGVAAGHLLPSNDEKLRVTFALSVSLGWMTQAVVLSGKNLGELGADFWRRTFDELTRASLEIYTQGMLTDRSLLDEYLAARRLRDEAPQSENDTAKDGS